MPAMQGLLKQSYTLDQFEAYLEAEVKPKLTGWRPRMIVDHNTGKMVWPGFDVRGNKITPAQRIENMSVDWAARGFTGGPHLLISPDGMINTVWPLWLRGTHSPSWNAVSWGIEHVGDFSVEQLTPEARAASLGAKKALFKLLGIEADQGSYKFHLEDPKTTHKQCPGKNFGTKASWLGALNANAGPVAALDLPHVHALTASAWAKTDLKRLEAFRDKAYQLKGIWHVGYGFRDGFKGLHVDASTTMTLEQANALFDKSVDEMADTISSFVHVPLSQAQMDGLVLIGWNIGTGALSGSTVIKRLNTGDVAGAADAFLMWNKLRPSPGAPLEVSPGLDVRRKYERQVFLGLIPAKPAASKLLTLGSVGHGLIGESPMNSILSSVVSFALERSKAIAGAAAAAAVTAGMAAAEQQLNITIPTEWKLGIVAFVAGIFVHNTPNKAPAAKA